METQKVFINEKIVARFSRILANQRLAHAYLFIGSNSVGKSETALAIAKLVNCDQVLEDGQPCEQCDSCIKTEAGNHPDVVFIEGMDGGAIKISQIRELVRASQLRPFEGKKKVFIIKDIEKLTTEGSNALLKTLEEPSKNSLLILTTSVPERNLDTVKSRCHAVRFFPVAMKDLSDRLEKDCGVNKKESYFLARFAEGCFGKSQGLFEKRFFESKNEIINQMVFSRENEAFLKTTLADKQATKEVLDVLLGWFRDLTLLKSGAGDEQLMHLDRLKDLEKLSSEYSFHQVREIINQIVYASKMLSDNLNIKIPLTLLREKIWVRL